MIHELDDNWGYPYGLRDTRLECLKFLRLNIGTVPTIEKLTILCVLPFVARSPLEVSKARTKITKREREGERERERARDTEKGTKARKNVKTGRGAVWRCGIVRCEQRSKMLRYILLISCFLLVENGCPLYSSLL